MAVCDLSLRLGSSESRKTLEQKFVFQIGTLNPQGINERFFYSTNFFCFLVTKPSCVTNRFKIHTNREFIVPRLICCQKWLNVTRYSSCYLN